MNNPDTISPRYDSTGGTSEYIGGMLMTGGIYAGGGGGYVGAAIIITSEVMGMLISRRALRVARLFLNIMSQEAPRHLNSTS